MLDFKNLASGALSAIENNGMKDMQLSAAAIKNLDDLIGQGVFKSKGDFLQFALKAFAQYQNGGGQAQPTTADVQNAIQNTDVASKLSSSDVEGKLTPLMTEAFMMMGKSKMGL